MFADVFMDGGFHEQLTRTDLAMARSVLFVDEFDGDDGSTFVEGGGFFDAAQFRILSFTELAKVTNIPSISTLSDSLGDNAKRKVIRQRGKLRVMHGEQQTIRN